MTKPRKAASTKPVVPPPAPPPPAHEGTTLAATGGIFRHDTDPARTPAPNGWAAVDRHELERRILDALEELPPTQLRQLVGTLTPTDAASILATYPGTPANRVLLGRILGEPPR